jgi:hypothetical protein
MDRFEKGLIVIAASLVLLASPAFAATQLQPGEWQTTETGTENGKPVPPKVEKECMTPEEARDAASLVNDMKKEMTEQGAQCQTFDVKQNGDSVAYTVKCAMQKQFTFDIGGTFTLLSATHYTGQLKSEITFAGQKMLSDKTIEGVWVGACKPGAGKKR